MAIVPQPKRTKIRNLFAYVSDEINAANRDLRDEADPDTKGRLDDTYVAGRDAAAKTHLSNAIKAVRWLADDLSVTVPTAYTDAEIDALEGREIREFDDGN